MPYNGAAASVNLGVYSITANAINSAGSGSTAGQINLRSDAFFSLVNGYGSIASGTTNQFNFYQTTGAGVFRGAIFSLNSITPSATRTFTLPDADGTLALTSSLGSYLPLAGGTLTGALNGTSATFSTEVTSSGGQGRFGGWATGAGYQGNALEVGVSGGNAFMIGYNRTSGSYIPLSIGGTTNQTTTIGGSSIVFQNNGVTALTIASTGAATFSSSVTATSGIFSLNTNGGSIGSVKNLTLLNSSEAIGNWSGINFSYSNSGTNFGYIGTIITSDSNNSLADLVFGVKASNSVSVVTEYMRIKGGGNVGIGTSSPTCRLDILGTNEVMNISGTNATSAYTGYYYNTSTLVGYIGNGSSILTGAASSDFIFRSQGALVYATNGNNERMRITSGGFTKARANGGSYFGGGYHEFVNNNNVSGDNCFVIGNAAGSNTANTSSRLFIVADGAADRLYIYGNGNVVNQNNSYGSLSDIKLKENITDASPKLNDLLKVKVRNYNLIGEDTRQIGVIAQELEEVFPAMIDESEDFEYVEVPQIDEEGNEVLNEEGEIVTTKERVSKGTSTKSVKYSVFVPMLIKAIQEQQEIINEMRAEIDSLKNQIK